MENGPIVQVEESADKKSRLVRFIGEYFIGTEAHRFWKEQRSFYKEYFTDKDFVKKSLRFTKLSETMEILCGRMCPNFIDIAVISNYFVSDKPPYLILVGEGARALWLVVSYINRRRYRELRNTWKKIKEIQKNTEEIRRGNQYLEGVIRKLEEARWKLNEGEEWKKGDGYEPRLELPEIGDEDGR